MIIFYFVGDSVYLNACFSLGCNLDSRMFCSEKEIKRKRKGQRQKEIEMIFMNIVDYIFIRILIINGIFISLFMQDIKSLLILNFGVWV